VLYSRGLADALWREVIEVITRTTRCLLLAVLILAGARSLSAQQTCTRHVELQGGFSMCIPDSWIVRERQNEKYKALFGQASDGFSPNINFRDEMSTMTLNDYVAAGVRQILSSTEKLGATSIEPLGQSDFTTDSGLRGIRAVFQTVFKSYLVRTIQYYFEDGTGRKLIVTCTSLAKNKEVFDRVFDRTVKSFRLG
jgi:hypothetical protein